MDSQGRKDSATICLEDIITDYVWKRYLKSIGRARRHFVQKKKYVFDFHWNSLNFRHSTSVSSIDDDSNLLDSVDFGSPKLENKRSRRRKKADSYISVDSDVGAPIILCSKQFENRGEGKRKYRFMAEMETPVSLCLEFHEYFTLGENTNIEIDLPQILSPRDDDSRPFVMTRGQSQTFESSQTRKVNKEVYVKGGYRTEAVCVVHEQETTNELEVNTTLSLDGDCFPVVVKRKADNKVVYTSFITNLKEVFGSHIGPNLSLEGTTNDENHTSYNVILTSRGNCKSITWKDQQTILMSEPIQGNSHSGYFDILRKRLTDISCEDSPLEYIL